MIDQTQTSYLVFGATGSVGSAVARRLTSQGARVLLVGRDEERSAALGESLGQPHAIAEAGQAEKIEAACEKATEAFGTLSGVVNCMGSLLLKPAHSTTDEEWQDVLSVNLFSCFAILRAAGRRMRREGGSVVFVSSAAAQTGMPNHEAIAAAKAGVEGLVRSAAATYATRGLRVNAIAPGLTKSKMTRTLWENEDAAEMSRSMHALGRLGEPEDVASAICWLLAPENHWITGQVLGVDGGLARIQPRQKRSS